MNSSPNLPFSKVPVITRVIPFLSNRPSSAGRVSMPFRLQVIMTAFFKSRGKLWGYWLFAHPFLDGNGRTLLLVFMELAFRAGFAIHWGQTNKDEYLQALSHEINEPGGRHLDKYLEPYIVPISRREDWPQIIGEIRGLDGLDKENVSYGSLNDPEVQIIYQTYRSR
ncbi:Protein involved in cell division [Cedecea neteri]|uniref:protein adenylyltransferase n=1 Tax=Cedecea neteri TaxID=158822 RepID=A0A2X2VBM4_9ENTR|nr:Protein involved in cell division [Cedecea neteri]